MDVVKQIRETPDMKDLKIVMVSGIDKTEECLAAGANAFLLKPYMPEALFDLLRP
jgi:CheY-like chemotaxis protein